MGFLEDTAVIKLAEGFGATIHEGWDIAGNTNGGYLMAIAARAMAELGQPHPVALTAHFLSPGRPGPAICQTRLIKQGKQFTTIGCTLASADKPLVELMGSFTELGQQSSIEHLAATPPELPPPEDCHRTNVEGAPALMQKIDLRLHPEDAGFFQGKPTGKALFRGWIKLIDEPLDLFSLILAADAFPPTVFNANLPVGWAPTVQMTTHIRSLPKTQWLRCRFSTKFITGGMLEEDGEVWDDSGNLVAQSRQLALIPKGPS